MEKNECSNYQNHNKYFVGCQHLLTLSIPVNGTFINVNNNSKSIYSSNIVMTVMAIYTITPRVTQYLTTESPLEMMENAFYFTFTLKALYFLKICKFSSCLFGHVEKRLD